MWYKMEKINNHVSEALDRLIEQYRESDILKKLFSSLISPVQEIESVFFDINEKRRLDEAEGKQLDYFGEIVGIGRQGFDDESYRTLIKAKIGINTSQGEVERIISIVKLLTNSNFVHCMNYFDATIGLDIDGEIKENLLDFIIDNISKLVAAGVRVDHITQGDRENCFGFAGDNQAITLGGFGTVTDPSIGAKLAYLKYKKEFFSFAGSLVKTKGFGTVLDPQVGGRLNKL